MSGVIVDSVGAALIVMALLGVIPGQWPYWVGAAAMLGGGFMIFEGAAGWCALRAMGLRTPV